MRALMVPALVLVASLATAQTTRYLSGFAGQGLQIVGSEDPRRGGGIGFGLGSNHPRLRWGSRPGELVREGYFHYTESPGVSQTPPNRTYAVGVLLTARWRYPSRRTYSEIGFGAQYSDRTTVDLDSKFNTTPMFGYGWELESDWMVGVRLLHVSNGGTRGKNQGLNSLLLVVTKKL